MDAKYKHFNQEATFKALPSTVLEAAREVAAQSFAAIEGTADGFVASGPSAWHAATATFRVTSAPEGARVAVELLVERAAMRGYMLIDVGGYYDGQIDKWFAGIAQRLGGDQGQVLVRKTTSGVRTRQGCMAGCLVWLIVGTCLGIASFPLDQSLFAKASGTVPGPFSLLASLLALLAGVVVFLYVTNPDAASSKFIRERLRGSRKKEQP
ncbi:MAG TPA: hypothetical protein VF784_00915 [Anaerolineales bacterium]